MALPLVIISTLLLICLPLDVQASNSLQNYHFSFKCSSDCSRYGCRKAKEMRDSCPGGTVYGVCGCCLQCAKLEGNECGGYRNMKGTCDEGLFCHVRKRRVSKFSTGRCKRVEKRGVDELVIQTLGNQIAYCHQHCTPKFCSMWPDAICSASKNTKLQRTCQFPCQHTTCQACYFVPKDEPPCRKCSKDDFDCLKKFGRCVKRDACTRAKYPCMVKARRKIDGNFLCKVPACDR